MVDEQLRYRVERQRKAWAIVLNGRHDAAVVCFDSPPATRGAGREPAFDRPRHGVASHVWQAKAQHLDRAHKNGGAADPNEAQGQLADVLEVRLAQMLAGHRPSDGDRVFYGYAAP